MWQASMSWNMPLLIIHLAIAATFLFAFKHFAKAKIGCLQFILFCSSFVVLYLVSGSPLKTLSHVSFSTHMLQMSILFFFVPPFFWLGIPKDVLKKWSPIEMNKKKKIIPHLALIAFSVLFFLYHLPPILTFLYRSTLIHTSFTHMLFILALVMWFPIINPSGNRKKYAMLSGILLMPACLLFVMNGFMGKSNATPFLNQLTLELCFSPDQMDALLPFRINTKMDQIFGGLLMLGLHKLSLVMAFRLGNRKNLNITLNMIRPSLRRVE